MLVLFDQKIRNQLLVYCFVACFIVCILRMCTFIIIACSSIFVYSSNSDRGGARYSSSIVDDLIKMPLEQ